MTATRTLDFKGRGNVGGRNLLRATALAEGGTGIFLLLLPSVASWLLFGQAPGTALGIVLGRFIGAALLALSLVCWSAANAVETSLASGVLRAMLLYNILASALLAYADLGFGLSGPVLWPGWSFTSCSAFGVWPT